MRSEWLPVDLPPDLLVGTSSFSWPEWHGPFYPPELPVGERIAFYATQFPTVEVDSSFYRCPTRAQTSRWARLTPESFRFALKVPRAITHDTALTGPDTDVAEFLDAVAPLGPRLGPCLLQFPYVARGADADEYRHGDRLRESLARWLDRWSGQAQWVVEVRNAAWLEGPLPALLAEYGVSLALTAYYTMPSLASMLRDGLDPLTGPLAYVRFLGHHKQLDARNAELIAEGAKPKGYTELIDDREAEMRGWVDALLPVLTRRSTWCYFNNHYAGFGPGSARLFARLWDEIHG